MEQQIVTTINGVNVPANAKIKFTSNKNPKREGSKAHARYQKYMGCKTVQEYLERDGTKADLKYDWDKGFIEIDGVQRESTES